MSRSASYAFGTYGHTVDGLYDHNIDSLICRVLPLSGNPKPLIRLQQRDTVGEIGQLAQQTSALSTGAFGKSRDEIMQTADACIFRGHPNQEWRQ